MIHVRCALGEFKLIDGEFVVGSDQLRLMFGLATMTPIEASEGPVDYAIAMRMVMNGLDYEILDSDYEQPDDGAVN